MIYQLIKLETPSRKATRVFAVVFLILLFSFSLTGPIGVMVLTASIGMLLVMSRTRRCTVFQAALPIPARDLWCAKLASHLAAIWLVLLTIVVAVSASHRPAKAQTAVIALEAGAIMTLGVTAVYSVRVRDFSPPRWWRRLVIAAMAITILIASLQTDGTSFAPSLTIGAFAVCVLGSAALFWKTWLSMPESFEMAAREPVARKSRESSFRLPSFPWLPVLRTLFSGGSLAYLCVLLVFGFWGTPGFEILFICQSILTAKTRFKFTHPFLLALPISRRKIFATIALAPLACFALGNLAQFLFSGQTARATIINATVVAGTSLLFVGITEIPSFARRLRPARAFLLTVTAFVVAAYGSWRWVFRGHGLHGIKKTPAEVWFGSILPARLPLLIVTAVALVGALYWLACEGFSRAEAPRHPAASSLNRSA